MLISIPNYLKDKLSKINILSYQDLLEHNYLKVFKWLRYEFPSLSFKTLFDLYCVYHHLPLNSLPQSLKLTLIEGYKILSPTYLPLPIELIEKNLNLAQEQAKIANEKSEVPIGAVVMRGMELISYAYNQTFCKIDITSHAEILAIRKAQQALNSLYLDGCDLYVTIEPCLMCAGAIIQSRLKRVIFGAVEPKTGSVVSQYKVFNNTQVNHHTEAIGPVNNNLYSQIIKDFFKQKR